MPKTRNKFDTIDLSGYEVSRRRLEIQDFLGVHAPEQSHFRARLCAPLVLYYPDKTFVLFAWAQKLINF